MIGKPVWLSHIGWQPATRLLTSSYPYSLRVVTLSTYISDKPKKKEKAKKSKTYM